VGDRFELGGLLLDRCGRQVRVGRVFVGEMWAAVSDLFPIDIKKYVAKLTERRFCKWRDGGERFGSGELSMEICGQQVQVGKVVVGEM
jgi:hypothetical protein